MDYVDDSTIKLIVFITDMFTIFFVLILTFGIIKKFFKKLFKQNERFK